MADKPVIREEKYLAYLTGDYKGELPKPITRKEKYLYELCSKGMGGEISPEEIKNAVNEYLEKNPVKPGATTEQTQQIERNKADIGLLKTETNSLKEELNDLKGQIVQGGNGVSKVMAQTLDAVIRAWAYESPSFATSQEYADFKEAWGIDGSDTPVTPPEGEPTTPTLTGITVIWSATSAEVGTDPKTLITSVTAHYSDGSTEAVYGYSVTPSALVKGAQTVTVTYGGKIASKSITGNSVAEPITINASYPITLSWNPTANEYDLSEPLGELHSEYDVEIDVQSVSASTAYPVMAIVGSGSTAFCNWQTSAGQTGTLKATATIGFQQGAGATKCQLNCNKGSESSNQTCVVTGLRVYRK